MEKPRRAPSPECFIRDISEKDIRVKVTGKVKEVHEKDFVLKDFTGEINVLCDELPRKGKLIRVIGTPIKTETKMTLKKEIVQDMDNLNEKLYKKIMSLTKR